MQYRGIEIWEGWIDPMYTSEVRAIASAIVDGKKKQLITSPIMNEVVYARNAKAIEEWMMKKVDELLFPNGEPVDLAEFHTVQSLESFWEETGLL